MAKMKEIEISNGVVALYVLPSVILLLLAEVGTHNSLVLNALTSETADFRM
jgi:hypothetical protein